MRAKEAIPDFSLARLLVKPKKVFGSAELHTKQHKPATSRYQ
jgi:hypothetical protein